MSRAARDLGKWTWIGVTRGGEHRSVDVDAKRGDPESGTQARDKMSWLIGRRERDSSRHMGVRGAAAGCGGRDP